VATEESEEPSTPGKKERRSKRNKTVKMKNSALNEARVTREMLRVENIDRETEFKALAKEKLDICAVIQQLAQSSMRRRIVQLNESDVREAVAAAHDSNSSSKFSSYSFRVFRLLDMNSNGSVDIDELLQFFFTFRKPEWDCELALDLAAAKLGERVQESRTAEQAFCEYLQISEPSTTLPTLQLDFNTFYQKLGQTLFSIV
jgi:hypothetical protein